jgi:hypothetical protein
MSINKSASHLCHAIGKKVVVTFDNPDRDVHALLDAIGPTGAYVIYDDGERKRVAAWRVSVQDDNNA